MSLLDALLQEIVVWINRAWRAGGRGLNIWNELNIYWFRFGILSRMAALLGYNTCFHRLQPSMLADKPIYTMLRAKPSFFLYFDSAGLWNAH